MARPVGVVKSSASVGDTKPTPSPASSFNVHEGLYAAGREFGLNVAREELAGSLILLQHGVKVRDRESSD
jgi:hypothetical protein